MTKISFYDGTEATTKLTIQQVLWLKEQVMVGRMVCRLIVDYEGVDTTVNVLDINTSSHDTVPAPSPFWE